MSWAKNLQNKIYELGFPKERAEGRLVFTPVSKAQPLAPHLTTPVTPGAPPVAFFVTKCPRAHALQASFPSSPLTAVCQGCPNKAQVVAAAVGGGEGFNGRGVEAGGAEHGAGRRGEASLLACRWPPSPLSARTLSSVPAHPWCLSLSKIPPLNKALVRLDYSPS